MARSVAVVIGVSKCGTLTPLDAVAGGVKDFAEWARREGFEVHAFEDAGGKKVRAQALFDKVDALLEPQNIERFFLFFAGHGALHSLNNEFWLLSDWERDGSEAINVSLTMANAKAAGIPHVAFFADACRSQVGKAGIALLGRSIFPSLHIYNVPTQWDHFLASRPGDPSQEVVTGDPLQSFGIFTKCLLEGLNGAAEGAIEQVRQDPLPTHAVTSQRLAAHIEESVPELSGATPGAAVQFPEALSGSRPPKHNIYCRVAGPAGPGPGPAGPGPGGGPARGPQFLPGGVVRKPRARTSPAAQQRIESAAKAADDRARAMARDIAEHSGRPKFESHVGLTVVGAAVKTAVVTGGKADLFQEQGRFHVRGREGVPQSAALELHDGRWIATALIPEFVGTIVVGERGVTSTSYVPSLNSRFEPPSDEARQRLARAMALFAQGRFSMASNESLETAQYLRNYKHGDPTFGILAAYAYDRAGDREGIRDMLKYFGYENQAVPFDAAFLSRLPMRRPAGAQGLEVLLQQKPLRVAGSFPLLTQGWTLLDPQEIPPVLREIQSAVLPSLWTLFPAGPGGALANAVQAGAL